MIRTGTIGVGYLGRFHAQKHKALGGLVGIYDSNTEVSQNVSEELDVKSFESITELLDSVDAVSIASATQSHYEVAKLAIQSGKHVLIEKPITESVGDAEELVALANQNKVLIQVGHIERFNPVFKAGAKLIQKPEYIECRRIAPFKPRGVDVNVILDLMIHDLDLVLSLTEGKPEILDVWSRSIVTQDIDLVRARLRIGETIVELDSHRFAPMTERRMFLSQHGCEVHINMGEFKLEVADVKGRYPDSQSPVVLREENFEKTDALYDEVQSFIQSIETNVEPVVSGQDGLNALQLAQEIAEKANV